MQRVHTCCDEVRQRGRELDHALGVGEVLIYAAHSCLQTLLPGTGSMYCDFVSMQAATAPNPQILVTADESNKCLDKLPLTFLPVPRTTSWTGLPPPSRICGSASSRMSTPFCSSSRPIKPNSGVSGSIWHGQREQ